jgi:hemerythrin-like domain-containing protein
MLGHFADDEEVLCPPLETTDPEGVARLRYEHAELRELVAGLAAGLDAGGDLRERMGEIGWLVHDHVRFEERALFESAQARLSAAQLADVGRALEQRRSARGLAPACPPRKG